MGSIERIEHVADKVKSFHDQGHQIVVAVSAMSGETNRLIGLAHDISEHPTPREMDVLVSTGEQVTIALLAMALQKRGINARSFTGWQVGIKTDSSHMKARIEDIDTRSIRAQLAAGGVGVVAGFQGIDHGNNIPPLARGGADTTGLAPAAA